MKFEIESPEFTFTWKWLVELLERILGDIFDFIYDEEWADKEEA